MSFFTTIMKNNSAARYILARMLNPFPPENRMKTQITSLILALVLTGASRPAAADRASGGGNGDTSNVAEVKVLLQDGLELGSRMFLAQTRLNLKDVRDRIPSRIVREAFEKIVTEPAWSLQTAMIVGADGRSSNRIKLDIKEKGGCFRRGSAEETDASTEYRVGAPVCVSAARLARYPKTILSEEMVGLFFHELAHQVGYGEDVADLVQAFIRTKYRSVELTRKIKDLHGMLRLMADPANESSFHDTKMCYELGLLAGMISSLPIETVPTSKDFTPDEIALLREMFGLDGSVDGIQPKKKFFDLHSVDGFLRLSLVSACSAGKDESYRKFTAAHMRVVLKVLDLFVQKN